MKARYDEKGFYFGLNHPAPLDDLSKFGACEGADNLPRKKKQNKARLILPPSHSYRIRKPHL